MGLPALLDSYIVRIGVSDDRVAGIDEPLEVVRASEGEPPLGDSHAGRGGLRGRDRSETGFFRGLLGGGGWAEQGGWSE